MFGEWTHDEVCLYTVIHHSQRTDRRIMVASLDLIIEIERVHTTTRNAIVPRRRPLLLLLVPSLFKIERRHSAGEELFAHQGVLALINAIKEDLRWSENRGRMNRGSSLKRRGRNEDYCCTDRHEVVERPEVGGPKWAKKFR